MKKLSYCVFLFVSIAIISCKHKKNLHTGSTIDTNHHNKSIFKDSIIRNDKFVGIDSISKSIEDSSKFESLPIGSSFVKFGFKENIPTIDENDVKIVNDTTIKIDSILNCVYKLMEMNSKKIISSEDGIQPPYDRKSIFLDRNSKHFEPIYLLPNKYGLNINIEKVSKKYNSNNNTEVQYCLSIYKNNKLVKRNNIGYVYYGDLVESYKVWYIDEEHIIHNRIIANVSGNLETYIGQLHTYKITPTGEILRYFDAENGSFNNKEEKGKIKNHLKEGFWSEKKYNPYYDQYSYIEANYKEGKPIDKWNYYDLVDDIKKGSKLLMTEEYSGDGELLKRNILNQE